MGHGQIKDSQRHRRLVAGFLAASWLTGALWTGNNHAPAGADRADTTASTPAASTSRHVQPAVLHASRRQHARHASTVTAPATQTAASAPPGSTGSPAAGSTHAHSQAHAGGSAGSAGSRGGTSSHTSSPSHHHGPQPSPAPTGNLLTTLLSQLKLTK